jgi:hypothetical protein
MSMDTKGQHVNNLVPKPEINLSEEMHRLPDLLSPIE